MTRRAVFSLAGWLGGRSAIRGGARDPEVSRLFTVPAGFPARHCGGGLREAQRRSGETDHTARSTGTATLGQEDVLGSGGRYA